MQQGRMLEIYFGENTTVCIIKLKGKPISTSRESPCYLHNVKLIEERFQDVIITPVGNALWNQLGREVNEYISMDTAWVTEEEWMDILLTRKLNKLDASMGIEYKASDQE
jgi:hypothetical protein